MLVVDTFQVAITLLLCLCNSVSQSIPLSVQLKWYKDQEAVLKQELKLCLDKGGSVSLLRYRRADFIDLKLAEQSVAFYRRQLTLCMNSLHVRHTQSTVTTSPTQPTMKVTPTQTVAKPMCSSPKQIPKASCAAWKQLACMQTGPYLIDPDGVGGVDSFHVHCNMSSEPPTVIVHHDRETEGHVKGYEGAGSHAVSITYDAHMDQIITLMANSGHCWQYLKWRCLHSAVWGGNTQLTWWVSRDGQKMAYWAGGPVNGEGCACAISKTCTDFGKKDSKRCNCDVNDQNWRKDDGYLTVKSTLPVSRLHFGDTGDSIEEGYYTLGPLECVSK